MTRMESAQARITTIITELGKRRFEAGLVGISVICVLAGSALLTFSLTRPTPKVQKGFYKAPKPAFAVQGDEAEGGAGELVIDIAGAVNEPGVYRLPAGSRLDDALRKAHGPSDQANVLYISKSLNLSERISDQQKIYIPSLGEEPPELSSMVLPTAIPSSSADRLSESPFLSINTASQSELESLPGIGEITAQKIIKGRPYTSIEDLSKNGILKRNIFNDIKSKISI